MFKLPFLWSRIHLAAINLDVTQSSGKVASDSFYKVFFFWVLFWFMFCFCFVCLFDVSEEFPALPFLSIPLMQYILKSRLLVSLLMS